MTDHPPLHGIRVLDLSRLLPGPYATMVLADLGARVDKVEDPSGGDYMRVMPPQVEGMGSVFHALNRGKRSVVLDLKKPEGRDAFLELVPQYDVLLESFRPGVMSRFGLGYEQLRDANPRLVYAAITGYGQDGPLAGRAGHDLNYVGRAGLLGFTGPEDRPPQVPGVQIADIGGGALFGAIGVLAALQERERTGRGRFVDVSMCEGSLAFTMFGLMSRLGGMQAPRGGDVLMGGIAPYQTYETKDGQHVTLGSLEPKFWSAFCTGVGIEPAMDALAPGPHQAGWKSKLAQIFAQRTRAEWEAFAEKHDCCLEPVLQPEELLTDPQHTARGVFLDGPGGLKLPTTPAGRPARAAGAPAQGEHTDEVLREAGLSEERMKALREAGAIR
ncbi:MAG: CaiB/BaiF CoA transferase family protein [Myxococcota bacterium]